MLFFLQELLDSRNLKDEMQRKHETWRHKVLVFCKRFYMYTLFVIVILPKLLDQMYHEFEGNRDTSLSDYRF